FYAKDHINGTQRDIAFHYYGGLYVINGTGTYIDQDGERQKIYPGCFVQRIPLRMHSTVIDESCDWLEFYICFGRSIYEFMADLEIFNNKQPVLHIGKSQKLLNNLIQYMDDLKNSANNELNSMLFQAMSILNDINHMSKNIDENENSFISSACQKLNENINIGVSLKEIALDLNMNYETFRKNFTKAMNVSPMQYLITERINQSKIMLLDGGLKPKDVATTLGYTDEFAFIKQFKKITSTTPTEFLKRQ
ncbi:AraC family transcriptional regulator, partial [bacterium]